MIHTTSDPSGDVRHHSRSCLIQAVSKVDLATFMSSFNSIVLQAFKDQSADGFYTDRGVEVHSMELTRYHCVDEKTAAALQEIIQETTNRNNRLQSELQGAATGLKLAKSAATFIGGPLKDALP